jgi:hypothetical protein
MTVRTLLLAFLLLLAAAGCSRADDADEAATPVGNADGGSIGDEPTDEPGLSESDQAQIYAAAVRQIYNVDHSFGNQSPAWPLVYLMRTTDDTVMPDAPDDPSQRLSGPLQEAIAAELAGEPFQLIWFDETEGAPIDPTNGQVADGEGIIITLGNIHGQDDGSVQLSFFMVCGGLCGIGKTYILNPVDNTWQVTGSTGPEIISYAG